MILDRFRLDNQVAVVTGAGRGLGAAIALAFAEVGADVVIAARTRSQLDEVAAQIRDTGRRAHVVTGDLAHPEATAELATAAVAEFGKLDIVVNNVGGSFPRPLLETSAAMFEKAFHFNVTTALELSKAAIPAMLASDPAGGSIVNISSICGTLGTAWMAGYSAAKAGINNFTQWLAVHLAQQYSPRIRVNAVAPGFFITEQNRALLTDLATGELTARGQSIIAHTPMGRFGNGEDLLGAVLWLMSPASAFVTGIVVPVDGGFSAFGGV